jgi:hypothetical protein
MAVKTATRGAQYPLTALFEFNITDTMVNTAGASQAFSAAAGIFDVIKLPANAEVTGGSITVETASDDTGTATVAVGDATSNARYLAATSIKAAARTALTLTGYVTNGEDLRITLANASGNATVGKVRINLQYVIKNRMTETQTY